MRIGINALDMVSEAGFAKAGVSRYCYNLVDALAQVGARHEWVVFVDPDFVPPEHWSGNSRLRLVPARGKLAKRKMLWNLVVAGGEARKASVDCWLSLAHALPLRAPCPTALTVHDLFTLLMPDTVTRRYAATVGRILPRSIRVANRILAVSEATKRDVLRFFPGKEVSVVPLAMGNSVARRRSEDVTDDELRSLGVPFARYLFTLSTLEPRKNLIALIEAFARLREKDPSLGLVVGGGKGWMASGVFDRVRELGLDESVKFLGYVDDEALPALFARCEAFVCASLVEGFGIPVLEAMTLGAAVVSSDRGSLPEVGGDAAIYFDPTDIPGMARAIESSIHDRVARAERIERGFLRATGFSWEKAARQTIAALEETAERR